MRRAVEDDVGGDAGGFDKLSGAADGIEIHQAGATRDKHQIGGLHRRERLRPCRRRSVDDGQS